MINDYKVQENLSSELINISHLIWPVASIRLENLCYNFNLL